MKKSYKKKSDYYHESNSELNYYNSQNENEEFETNFLHQLERSAAKNTKRHFSLTINYINIYDKASANTSSQQTANQ
jgi:hypothetical protein